MNMLLLPLLLACMTDLSAALRLTAVPSRLAMSIVEPKAAKQLAIDRLAHLTASAMPFVLALPVLARTSTEEERKLIQPPDKYSDVSPSLSGTRPDYKAVRADIMELIRYQPDKGPTLVRLAWHSSGTYDKMSKTGGSMGGTMRFKEELDHGANGGLDNAVAWLEPIYKKWNRKTDLSYGDLYTLAGVVAIETLGGPKIPWRAGRQVLCYYCRDIHTSHLTRHSDCLSAGRVRPQEGDPRRPSA
jgi:hypothetical protein